MTRGEAINWLTNILTDIGKPEHRELWYYEQALSEIKKMLECEPKRWILMTERPPEPGERVFVITDSHDYFVWDCMSDRGDNYFWEDESGYYHNKDDVVA